MKAVTTIKVSTDTKYLIEALKSPDETFEAFIRRLLDEYSRKIASENPNIRKLLEEVGLDPDSWKEIVVRAYKNLGITNLEKLLEVAPDEAKEIIKKIVKEG